MKTSLARLHLTAVTAAVALAASLVTSRAQTPVMLPYTWTFPINVQVGFPLVTPTNFPDPTWIYWYNLPGGNTPMTDDVSMDVFNNTNSGCLIYSVPFANASNTQDVIFGSFGNKAAYDTTEVLNANLASNINFWIRADPSTAPRQVNGTNVDYGSVSVGFFYPYSFESQGNVTIPLSASNAWVHLTVPVNLSSPVLTGITGVALGIATFGNTTVGTNTIPNYPALQNSLFYLDNIQVAAGAPPLPPTIGRPYAPISGFNAIATTPGTAGEFNREQIVTAADTGYTFYNQTSPSYSFNIKSYPNNINNAWQAHFFIVSGAPGQFDQPVDYNLSDTLWFTVGPGGTFNFRLKTNEPFGNSMLFNTFSPTDTVNNPNGWPVEPIAVLTDPNGPLGTWTYSISGNTSITVTSPSGLTTNFSITPAQAALFADPVTLILGGQPNNPSGAGQAVVYSSFTASGVVSSFTDNFLQDSSFNTNLWLTRVASDTNGVVLVPTNALFWVPWTLPDSGYVLQTKSDLGTPSGWMPPNSLIIRNGSGTAGTNSGVDQALILSTQVADPTQGYFQLIQFHATMLQVLLGGQTNAPGTTLGYTGSPTPISGAALGDAAADVTVNAVDSTFHIDTSIEDVVEFTTSADPEATEPNPTPLVHGTLSTQVLFGVTGNYTVTAMDQTNPNPPSTTGLTEGTSAPITVNP